MYKRTISYTDFDGNERTEDFYFNITKAEATQLELSVPGGMKQLLENIIQTKDHVKLIEYFTKLVDWSYGVKSPDGRKMMKSKEILDDFRATAAYSDFYCELASNDQLAAEFIRKIFPNG